MGTTLSRLQLAQRIHHLLLREIDHAIEIEQLLTDPRYARDVLLVCQAAPGGELLALAALFRESSDRTNNRSPSPGYTPQTNDWSQDTSGFGITLPPPMPSAGGSRRATDSEPAPLDAPRHAWLPSWRNSK